MLKIDFFGKATFAGLMMSQVNNDVTNLIFNTWSDLNNACMPGKTTHIKLNMMMI